MDKTYLTVIIPCYNELENIKKGALASVNDFLKTKDYKWEVIVSDDGSLDESADEIGKEIKSWSNFHLLNNEHGGKPSALWHGIKEAKGAWILFSDMDQSTPIKEIDKLTPFAEKNTGAVIGSRGVVRKNFPFYRKLGSIVFMTFRKALILPEINDTQCGFKLFEKSVVAKAFPQLEFFKKNIKVKGWKVTSFDVELLHIIKKMGYEIKEIPVEWQDKNEKKISKVENLRKYIKESQEMLFQILRVKVNESKGLYNKA